MPRIACVPESELSRRQRRQAGKLLAREWGAQWRADAYAGEHAPSFRVLALDDADGVVGHVSAFAIPTAPPVRMLGIGDLVVAPPKRGRGISRAICHRVVHESWGRRAEVILVDTVAAAATFRALGFEPARGFEFFYEAEGACRRQPGWLCAWAPGRSPRARIELREHGDF